IPPWDMFNHIRDIDFKGLERHVGFQPAGLGGIPAAQVFCGQGCPQNRRPSVALRPAQFNGSLLSLLRTHWNHDPLNRPSAFAKATADESGTFSPAGGEGRDEGAGSWEAPFVLRMHWDHEPDWHPSPCPLP